MIDMTSTFPYFLVRNSGEAEEVPSIIVPSADGTYYKVFAEQSVYFLSSSDGTFVRKLPLNSLNNSRYTSFYS